MKIREQDKHFLWSLFAAIGVIFVWKGLWEGIYEIPYIGDPWVALFIGLTMLTFSGLIFREFDPLGGVEKSVKSTVEKIKKHPKKEDFLLKYYDKSTKKEMAVNAKDFKRMEENMLIFKHKTKKQEVFIPLQRITEIIHNGNTYWRL